MLGNLSLFKKCTTPGHATMRAPHTKRPRRPDSFDTVDDPAASTADCELMASLRAEADHRVRASAPDSDSFSQFFLVSSLTNSSALCSDQLGKSSFVQLKPRFPLPTVGGNFLGFSFAERGEVFQVFATPHAEIFNRFVGFRHRRSNRF